MDKSFQGTGKRLVMKNKGFSLVEVLIAMAIGAIIMAAVYGVMTVSQRSSTSIDRKTLTQQDTRSIMNLMATEIRMASYNPLMRQSTWTLASAPDISSCYTGEQSFKGVRIAKDNQIAIAMDITPVPNPVTGEIDGYGDGWIGNTSEEYITYTYNPANKSLTRRTSCGFHTALLGGTALHTNVINADAGVQMFRYFGPTDNEITASVDANPSAVSGIPAIRRVLITLVVETADPDLQTGQTRKMVYSTNVILRNHVSNEIPDNQ
jgi:prepilin-type N-terminal cleavage/methylation domain-containing protein